MLSNIIKDSQTAPKTIMYKILKKLLILADEEQACKNPNWAYIFARDVPGANIEKCQETACKEPYYAYVFAKHIPGANIKKCYNATHSSPYYKCIFSKYIIINHE